MTRVKVGDKVTVKRFSEGGSLWDGSTRDLQRRQLVGEVEIVNERGLRVWFAEEDERRWFDENDLTVADSAR